MLEPSWGVFWLMAFIGLPTLLYLVIAYYLPLWRQALRGNLELEAEEEVET